MTAAEEESFMRLLAARMDVVVPHALELALQLKPALDVLAGCGHVGDIQLFAVLVLARRLQLELETAAGGRREVGATVRKIFELEIDKLVREGDGARGVRLPGVILR